MGIAINNPKKGRQQAHVNKRKTRFTLFLQFLYYTRKRIFSVKYQ